MKKQFTFIVVVLLVTFIGVQSPTHGQWLKTVIDDDNISTAVSVDVADMDGDTKLDLVVTNEGKNELILYQNNFPYWIKHTIDANAPSVTFAWSGDINNNNTLDVVACLCGTKDIVWYENNHPTWTKHIIDENTDNADFMLVADIDGDDTLDVVTAGSYTSGGDVVWYENNHPNWTKHIIESGTGKYSSLNVTDIDGDGLLDIVATMNTENKVVWFKSSSIGTPFEEWNKYTIDDNLNGAWGINSGDINGDNKIDVVATGRDANDVIWYENNYPTWTKHVINENLNGANWVSVSDVDGDDTMDVIAVGLDDDDVVWYKNNHPTWTKNIIDASLARPRLTAVRDIDGDNINDLFVAGGSCVAWYKNPFTVVAYAQSLEVHPKYLSANADTLFVNASLVNPENHTVSVYAIIQGESSVFPDSIELFDDGIATDNIFGGSKWYSDLEKDFYSVKLHTTDLDESLTAYFSNEELFTTAGPIVIESYSVEKLSDTYIKLVDFKLKNNGTEITIENIFAKLITSDTCFTRFTTGDKKAFGDIPAGDTKSVSNAFGFTVDSCATIVNFELEISSNEVVYWTDSLRIVVTDVKDEIPALPNEFALEQNYPNPFNPSTIISYDIPIKSNVTLKVYDVLGREVTTLVNQQQKAGYYEVEWDAVNNSSGIYFYRIHAGDFVETKKMVLMK